MSLQRVAVRLAPATELPRSVSIHQSTKPTRPIPGSLSLLLIAAICVNAIGCRREASNAAPKFTATAVRSQRRAYDGSPPVIPHEPLGLDCTQCHTDTGKAVPNFAFAPANPHGDVGNLTNCKQCHLFKSSENVADFVG